MSRRKRRSAQKMKTLDNMDVTPLVDLTFILLIVFMLTAPALEYAMDITPPALNTGAIDLERQHEIINVNQAGNAFFRDQEMSVEALETHMKQVFDPQTTYYVRGDGGALYDQVIKVLGALKRAGVTQVELVTRAEEQ